MSSGLAGRGLEAFSIEDGSMVHCGFRNRTWGHDCNRFTGAASEKRIHCRQPASANLDENQYGRSSKIHTDGSGATVSGPSPTVPTAFGIYAISNGKLHELDVLPARRPSRALPFRPSLRRIAVRRCRTDTLLSSSIVGIQRPMRPIEPRSGSLPGSSEKRTSTRMESRLLRCR